MEETKTALAVSAAHVWTDGLTGRWYGGGRVRIGFFFVLCFVYFISVRVGLLSVLWIFVCLPAAWPSSPPVLHFVVFVVVLSSGPTRVGEAVG